MNAAASTSSAIAVLARLDSYMAASGYDAEHPWRSEIVAALAVPALAQHDVDTEHPAAVTAGALDALNTPASECWVPVTPGSMPPDEVVVIGWDSTTGKPCAVFFDFNPGVHSWISQFDPTTIYEGEITHWRYCQAPADADSEGVTS